MTSIHNGIDLRKAITHRTPADVRHELGIEANALVIGTVGRLAPVKGHESFLRAARAILDQEPRAAFVIAGSGPREPQLRALASSLGIAPACRFLWRPQRRIRADGGHERHGLAVAQRGPADGDP